jgi:pimeloyl-ACP methyl ester carboxylesterase
MPVDAAPPPAPPERWAATVVIGASLRDFVIEFADRGATLELGDAKVPLVEVTHADDKLAFAIDKQPKETYELARKGDVAAGKGAIGRTTLPIRMVKLADGEAPHSAFPRPQTPKPPFPYEERELVVDAPDGGKLAGTLTIPQGTGPFPAVLLLSGSGQQDRDETIFGHKPYLIVADRLTRAGFATYRFDDRGTGKTVGAPLSLDTEIDDAGAILDVLKKQKEIDPKRVGIIGHSAGGMVAPNAAIKHPVAFIVLLAGATLSGREYSAFQTERELRASGADDKALAEQRTLQARVTAAAIKGTKEVEAIFTEIATPELEKSLGRKPTADEVKQAIAAPVSAATNPWVVSYFRIDPRVAWKKLAIPVLLLVGDKDTQVPADMTIKGLEDTVPKKLVTAKKLAGLNHLFQHAQSGEVEEYLTNVESFDPDALEQLTGWLVDHTKKK